MTTYCLNDHFYNSIQKYVSISKDNVTEFKHPDPLPRWTWTTKDHGEKSKERLIFELVYTEQEDGEIEGFKLKKWANTLEKDSCGYLKFKIVIDKRLYMESVLKGNFSFDPDNPPSIEYNCHMSVEKETELKWVFKVFCEGEYVEIYPEQCCLTPYMTNPDGNQMKIPWSKVPSEDRMPDFDFRIIAVDIALKQLLRFEKGV